LELDCEYKVGEVSADGTAELRVKVISAHADDRNDVHPQLAAAARDAVRALTGLTGTTTLDRRGIASGSTLQRPAVEPMAIGLVEPVVAFLKRPVQPLPAEAVGRGARWNTTAHTNAVGITARATTTTELVTGDERRLELRLTLVAESASQNFEMVRVDPGTRAPVMSMTGRGSGRATVDLARVGAVSGESEVVTKGEMAMARDGEEVQMAFDQRFRMVERAR
jgi:hypothetical protein